MKEINPKAGLPLSAFKAHAGELLENTPKDANVEFDLANTVEDELQAYVDNGMVHGVAGTLLELTQPPTTTLRKDPVARLVLNSQLYRCFLGMLLSGAALKDAAGSMGLLTKQLEKWLVRGRTHLQDGKDTWESRFFSDVLRAKSQARVAAQAKVHKQAPKAWLHNEADGRGWSEAPIAGLQPESQLDVEPEDDDENSLSVANPQVIAEVFRRLHQAGALPNVDVLVKEAFSQESHGQEEDSSLSPGDDQQAETEQQEDP